MITEHGCIRSEDRQGRLINFHRYRSGQSELIMTCRPFWKITIITSGSALLMAGLISSIPAPIPFRSSSIGDGGYYIAGLQHDREIVRGWAAPAMDRHAGGRVGWTCTTHSTINRFRHFQERSPQSKEHGAEHVVLSLEE